MSYQLFLYFVERKEKIPLLATRKPKKNKVFLPHKIRKSIN